MKRVSFVLFVLLLIIPSYALSEEVKEDVASSKTLDEVVVTVTRTETTSDRIGGSSVTVITAEEIEAKKQHSVEEILKSVPGLDIKANGGLGTSTAVFMRGADSKNTLVLIDGIMFNDPSQANRSANLAHLTTDNIERIEVVRGAMSVMYGSNATAGVVNIITKEGKDDPAFYVGSEGGSYSTWKAYAGASGKANNFNYSLTASHLKTDGYSTSDRDNDDIPHAGNTSEEDGYKNTTLSGKIAYDITDDFNITAISRYIDSEVDEDYYNSGYTGDRFDGWPATPTPGGPKKRRTESEQVFAKLNVKNSFFDKYFESNLSYQLSKQERQSYDNDGDKSYDFEGDVDEISWQGNLNFSTNTLSFGSTYLKEAMESKSASLTDENVKTISYWMQDQFFIGEDLVLVAGVRIDDHEEFGSEATYRIAPSYNIEKTGTIVKASYGTGFRAPSLYELCHPLYGNPNLDAEESKGWDIGFEQGLMNNKISFGLTYFNMVFKDRIDFDMLTWTYDQLKGKTKTHGIETFIGWTARNDLEFLLNYTYTDTEDPDGKRLERRPYNKFLLNTRYRFLENGLLNLDIYWVDDRKASKYAEDGAGNSVDSLDSYTLVNVSASYDFTDHFQIYGRIDNLFDKYYEECWSYATPGISGYTGVKVTF